MWELSRRRRSRASPHRIQRGVYSAGKSPTRAKRRLCVACVTLASLFLPLRKVIGGHSQQSKFAFPRLTARSWQEADQLFRHDPRWLGGDVAYSIDLTSGRVLWLFGDSFIAKQRNGSRRNSVMIRNSVAIETGYDPARAKVKFYWRTTHESPTDFSPGEGRFWLWPSQGIRLGNHLLLFYGRLAPDNQKNSLGFKSAGWTAFLVDNPDQQPSRWKLQKIPVPDDHGKITYGMSALKIGRFLYVFGCSEPEHDVYLIRWPLAKAAKGQLLSPQWWCASGWCAKAAMQKPILRDVSSEFSVQRDPRGAGFIEINSQGFGASTVVARSATNLEGHWSEPREIYRPAESNRPDAFVYAGKSHPELTGADVVVTYVANSSSFATLVRDTSIYYPRFVRLDLR